VPRGHRAESYRLLVCISSLAVIWRASFLSRLTLVKCATAIRCRKTLTPRLHFPSPSLPDAGTCGSEKNVSWSKPSVTVWPHDEIVLADAVTRSATGRAFHDVPCSALLPAVTAALWFPPAWIWIIHSLASSPVCLPPDPPNPNTFRPGRTARRWQPFNCPIMDHERLRRELASTLSTSHMRAFRYN